MKDLLFQFALLVLTACMAPASAGVQFYGLDYSTRKGPDSAPDAEKCKTASEIEKDLTTLKTVTDRVRIYSLTDCNQGELVLRAASTAGMQVMLGIWTSSNATAVEAETSKLDSLIKSGLVSSTAMGIFVGSEAIFRGDISADDAVKYMKSVKQQLSKQSIHIPVSIADTADIYYQYKQLVDAVDMVAINQFSFWEHAEANDSMALMLDRVRGLREKAEAQNKSVWVSETGWASTGTNANTSIASMENQALYFKDFYHQATARNLSYFWFSAFDAQWRIANGDKEVEASFGVFYENRTMKPSFSSLDVGTLPPKVLRAQSNQRLLTTMDDGALVLNTTATSMAAEYQTWLWDTEAKQVRSLISDRCLNIYQGEQGGYIVNVFNCTAGDVNQQWKYDASTGIMQHATQSKLCLSTDPSTGKQAQVLECGTDSTHQKWEVVDAKVAAQPSPLVQKDDNSASAASSKGSKDTKSSSSSSLSTPFVATILAVFAMVLPTWQN